jgi:hypothetical protein
MKQRANTEEPAMSATPEHLTDAALEHAVKHPRGRAAARIATALLKVPAENRTAVTLDANRMTNMTGERYSDAIESAVRHASRLA